MFYCSALYLRGLFLIWSLLTSSAALGQNLIGTVTRVVDGDTVVFQLENAAIERVRLADIDAPERDQPWGADATRVLHEWSLAKTGEIKVVDKDRYGRLVATLWVDDENINRRLVGEGFAWVYRKYLRDDTLIELEARAKSKQLGLWSGDVIIKPSDWRRGVRESRPIARTQSENKSVVKKSRSEICHPFDSVYYERTKQFESFQTLESCLASGGRLPIGYH